MSLDNNSNEPVIYKHNDNTDSIQERENGKLDIKRRHMTEYDTIMADMEIIYNEYREDSDDLYVKYYGKQINNIRKLAKKLEDSGYVLEKICAKVSRDVEKYEIDSRRVREALDDKYKQSKHDKTLPSKRGGSASYLVVTNQVQNDWIVETEQNHDREIREPIQISNEGSAIYSTYGTNNPKKTIDFNELKKQAFQEIGEDNAEQLDYSSSSSLSIKNNIKKLKQKDQLIQKLGEENQRLRDDWQFEVDRNRKGLSDKIKVADTIVLKENEELKKQIRALQTKLDEIDKETIIEGDKLLQGYKEIEILKLDDQRISWLMQTSRDSERTVFLLANPKTLEILQIKTDKEMHRIQALRDVSSNYDENSIY